jgi:hypothetical protein
VNLGVAAHAGAGGGARARAQGLAQAIARSRVQRGGHAFQYGARDHQLGAQLAGFVERVGAARERVAVEPAARAGRPRARRQQLRSLAFAFGLRGRQLQRA